MALNNLFSAYEKYNINPMKKKKYEENNQNLINNSVKKVNNVKQSNITSQYLENKVMTAPQEELTLMLYDGAIRFANKAIMKIEAGNIQESHNAIIRVQDIYRELMISLDMKYEISSNLHSLYDYINTRLIEANSHKDIEILKEVVEMSRGFRDTWAEAMKIAKKK